MSTAYREQGRAIDETEVEIARIREAEETKREALAERMKDRAATRQARYQAWKESDALGVLAFFVGLVFVATPATIAIMYCAHLWWSK